jgi:hypothetical protein
MSTAAAPPVLKITLVYSVSAVVIGVAVGLVAALALNRPFRGAAIRSARIRACLAVGAPRLTRTGRGPLPHRSFGILIWKM